jgi:hypothetical protein
VNQAEQDAFIRVLDALEETAQTYLIIAQKLKDATNKLHRTVKAVRVIIATAQGDESLD